ncbi:hypothetical protein, partial [Salmonella sp. SAL4434]|uniref:hypothetical protein n=1 Tax=Salmonella sp. SAL4434 TaxID=3159889 RepID=UPI00397BE19A
PLKTKNSTLFFVITVLYEKHSLIIRHYKTKKRILKPTGMHKLESVVQTQHRNNKNDTPDY